MLHPVKQGLKHGEAWEKTDFDKVAMLHPVKQGLKPHKEMSRQMKQIRLLCYIQ